MMDREYPLATLFLLALPIACIAWTVTHEEVFRQPSEPHHAPVAIRHARSYDATQVQPRCSLRPIAAVSRR